MSVKCYIHVIIKMDYIFRKLVKKGEECSIIFKKDNQELSVILVFLMIRRSGNHNLYISKGFNQIC